MIINLIYLLSLIVKITFCPSMEIYNFKHLKNKYLKHQKYTTKSDTEVLLNLLKKKENKFLKELNGIFAISFYDLDK